jgi:23S rRNA pseudouridine1911/1915/1917 synthase
VSEQPEIPGVIDVTVPLAMDGTRVDKAVALLAGLPRRTVAELVDEGAVRINGQRVTSRSRLLGAGQQLHVDVPPAPQRAPAPDPTVLFTVVHDDADLIVVDKPAGLVVHHGAGHAGGTLVDGLIARFPDLATLGADAGGPLRPGLVHRLDRGTSGLLVVARSPAVYRLLSEQLRARTAQRDYAALLAGEVAADAGVVEAPIGRSSRDRTRMSVTPRGKAARTTYRVVQRWRTPVPLTMVRASLDTGRTHQVRVHAAAIGHPVIGDNRYGGAAARPASVVAHMAPGRLFLHAVRLSLDHPAHGRVTWSSALPDDLTAVVTDLGE